MFHALNFSLKSTVELFFVSHSVFILVLQLKSIAVGFKCLLCKSRILKKSVFRLFELPFFKIGHKLLVILRSFATNLLRMLLHSRAFSCVRRRFTPGLSSWPQFPHGQTMKNAQKPHGKHSLFKTLSPFRVKKKLQLCSVLL